MHKNRILCVLWLLGAALLLFSADERPLVGASSNVYVRYQYQSPGGNWSTSGTTLKGAISESMMINQISQRHPGKKIRILSAKCEGKSRRSTVRYQYRNGEGPWNTGSATLQDALTESMARNQLSQRHPNAEIRILGMTAQ